MAKVFGRLIEGNCSGEYGRLVVAACFVLVAFSIPSFAGWDLIDAGTSRHIMATSSHGDTIIGVGYQGLVMKSYNQGMTWEIVAFPNRTEELRDVAHINASTIVAVGSYGSCYLSNDGGTTWTVVKTLTNTYPKLGLYCSPRGRVWVTCNDGEVVYSDDTCKSWKSVLPGYPNSVAGQLGDIEFSDQQLTGWIVLKAERSLLRTTDGGANWKVVPIAIADRAVWDCRFVDELRGLAVGEYGGVFLTTNGGSSWRKIDIGRTSTVAGVYWRGKNEAWLVGAGGMIMRSLDKGETWEDRSSSSTRGLRQIRLHSDSILVAVGDFGAVLRTSDDGQPILAAHVSPAQTSSCLGNVINVAVLPKGGHPPYAYEWLLSDGSTITESWYRGGSTSRDSSISLLPPTSISIVCHVTDAKLSQTSAAASRMVMDTPIVILREQPQYVLDAASDIPVAFSDYAWYMYDGTYWSLLPLEKKSVLYPSQDGLYQVHVQDIRTECSGRSTPYLLRRTSSVYTEIEGVQTPDRMQYYDLLGRIINEATYEGFCLAYDTVLRKAFIRLWHR
ncbi:MAG: hypothetical protein IPI29_14440 [Ignavibacteria bacterium]|nr:hypothetical protein [Ignavibacteria bacterium]